MNTESVLGTVFETLDHLQIPWMLVGSFASNFYGEPRSTHDADLVIEVARDSAKRIATTLGADFIVSDESPAARPAQFNAIHASSGFKVDFWPLRDDPFDRTAFARRRVVTLFGHRVPLPTAEDLILQKLRWDRESQSDQQRRDVVAILRAQGENLDWHQLRRWADTLGLTSALDAARQRAAG